MPTREELQAQIEAKRAERKEAAQATHDDEYVNHVAPILEERDDVVEVEVVDAPADLPGWCVFRCPNKAEQQRFKQTLWRGEGSEESKAKAGAALAVSCRLYPEQARYNELVDKRPGVAEKCAEAVLRLSNAGTDKQEKK